MPTKLINTIHVYTLLLIAVLCFPATALSASTHCACPASTQERVVGGCNGFPGQSCSKISCLVLTPNGDVQGRSCYDHPGPTLSEPDPLLTELQDHDKRKGAEVGQHQTWQSEIASTCRVQANK